MTEVKKYVARMANGMRITSVFAKDAAEAQRQVDKALSAPGRYALRSRWLREGSKVEEE